MLPLLDTHQHLVYPDRLGYGWAAGAPGAGGARLHARRLPGAHPRGGRRRHDLHGGRRRRRTTPRRGRAWSPASRAVPASGILGIIASLPPRERDAGFDAWLEEGRGPRRRRLPAHPAHVGADDRVADRDLPRQRPQARARAASPSTCASSPASSPSRWSWCAPAPTRSSSSTTAATPTSPPAPSSPGAPASGRSPPMPNVVAKLSGVYANVAPGTASLETVRPYVEEVIETFGPDRCLWGSDWPVVNVQGGDLPYWIAAFRAILVRLLRRRSRRPWRTAPPSGSTRCGFPPPGSDGDGRADGAGLRRLEQPRHRADGDARGHAPLRPRRALAGRSRRRARRRAGSCARRASPAAPPSIPTRSRACTRTASPCCPPSSKATARSTSWSSCSAPTTSSTASRCRWSRSPSRSASLVHAIRHSYCGPGMAPARRPPRRAAADPRGRLPRRDLRGRRRQVAAPRRRPMPPSRSATAPPSSTPAR